MGVVVRCHPTQDQQEEESPGLPVISLSIHPPVHAVHTIHTIHKSVWWSIYTLYTNIRVSHTPDIVLSKRPKPSMVAVSCDVVCLLLSSLLTIGWNASNLSRAHREDTPDTLLVNVESIFSLMPFLQMPLQI